MGSTFSVSSGERPDTEPAQDLNSSLGKIICPRHDNTAADGNPFPDRGGVASECGATDMCDPLGLAFDADGNLWDSKMGPQGGDELNLVRDGANYGWPQDSNGSHYSGEAIPNHTEGDRYKAPKVAGTPASPRAA